MNCTSKELLQGLETRLWQIIPKKSPIILCVLFSDIEPIIFSKVPHYSQIILDSEHIVCSIKLHAVKYDVKFLIYTHFGIIVLHHPRGKKNTWLAVILN